MSYFKGKTIIVTGASSGIGEATAKEFLLKGAKVILYLEVSLKCTIHLKTLIKIHTLFTHLT